MLSHGRDDYYGHPETKNCEAVHKIEYDYSIFVWGIKKPELPGEIIRVSV